MSRAPTLVPNRGARTAGALIAGVLGCLALSASAQDPVPPSADPSPARSEAWQVGGCALCHVVPGQPTAAREDSCADCHAWIRKVAASPDARTRAMEIFPLWERYEKNVATYLPVPSLAAAMARLEPAWVDRYLQDPHDLRPGLPEGMPRFALTAEQRGEIVAAFAKAKAAVPATPAPDPTRVDAGRALFDKKGCAMCHSLGSAWTDAGIPLAPDLAVTRQRMSPDMVAAWIRDPRALSTDTVMPTFPLTDEEVLALRDYVLLSPIEAAVPVAAQLPPPTTSPVTWADVEAEVFGKICVHCHMDPDQNQGRRGPGNAGGFGWPASGIELQTYEGVVAVADRIPDALLRRRQEAVRDHVAPGELPQAIERPELPGMPLGLPPIDDEGTAMVLGWIAQGMPR